MDAAADDVFRTIEFSRDRWRMSKVPWALLLLLAGLSFALFFDPTPSPRGLLVMFLLMVAALVGVILVDLVFEAVFSADSSIVRRLAGAIVVLAVIAMVLAWLTTGIGGRSRGGYGAFPGWLIVFICLAWIGHALYRHLFPERPQLALSSQGLGYRIPGALDVLIPWREIESIGSLALAGLWQTGGADSGRGPTVFHVSQAFYDRHIYVRNLLLRGPNWDSFFTPVDGSIRILLNHAQFSVEAKDIRTPLEARWKAFRDSPAPSLPAIGDRPEPAQDRLVVGRWTWSSYWDLAPFLIPLAGIVAVVADALIRH